MLPRPFLSPPVVVINLSANVVTAGRCISMFLLLLRVMLQPVKCARFLLQGLLKVGDQNARVLDTLAEALDAGLDHIAKFQESFQLIAIFLPFEWSFDGITAIIVNCWSTELVQNCNSMVEIWTLRLKCRELGLGCHSCPLDESEVLSQFIHLGLDFNDLLV